MQVTVSFFYYESALIQLHGKANLKNWIEKYLSIQFVVLWRESAFSSGLILGVRK